MECWSWWGMLGSILLGLHMPVLHEIVEHGARPQWDVLGFSLVFAAATLLCAWKLLRIGATTARDPR